MYLFPLLNTNTFATAAASDVFIAAMPIPLFPMQLMLQYLVRRYVGVRAVTSTTGGLHVTQPFYSARLRGIGN
jgi:hypothetical protein